MIDVSFRVISAIKKDLIQLFRDKAGVALIFIQPMLIMLLLGLTFQSGMRDIPIILVDNDHSSISTNLSNYLTSSDTFQLVQVLGSEDEAKAWIRQGRAEAAVIVESNFSNALLHGGGARIKLLVDGSQPLLMRTIMFSAYMLGNEITKVNTEIYKNTTSSLLDQLSEFKENAINSRGAVYELTSHSFPSLIFTPFSYLSLNSLAGSSLNSFYYQMAQQKEDMLLSTSHNLMSVGRTIDANLEEGIDAQKEVGHNIDAAANIVLLKGKEYNDSQLVYSANVLKTIAQRMQEAEAENMSQGFKLGVARINAQLLEPSSSISFPSSNINPSFAYNIPKPTFALPLEYLSLLTTPSEPGNIVVDYDVLYGGDKLRTLDLMAPLIIALSVAFSALILTTPSIAIEREQGTLERLLTTPIRRGDILLGKIISRFLFSIMQALVMIVFGIILFRMNVSGSLWILTIVLIPVSISHLGMGVMVSSLASSERVARYAIPMITMTSIMLSGFMVPVDVLPSYIRIFANFVPLKYANEVLIGVMIKGASLSDYSSSLLTLVGFSILFFIGGIYAFMKRTEG